LPFIDGRLRGYYTPTFTHLYPASAGFIYVLPPADGTHAEWDKTWVVRNHLANRNYYNPNIKYVPWPGTKADGSPMYDNANPKAALEHPDIPGGESVNLTINHSYTEPAPGAGGVITKGITSTTYYIPTYYKWSPTDGDGDGVIEASDLVGANVLAAMVKIPPDSAEMQNFANWFQYYRSRMNATKSVVGSTINNTDASRMGIRMYNTGPMVNLQTMSDTALKRNLLGNLYNFVTPARGTPARTALEATGNYFADNASGAILNAANGGECQQNFNVLMSDGFWNGSTNPSVGNADTDGAGPFDGNQAQSNDGGNYADSYSNTLADVAMHYYETDLRGDLGNKVPTQTGIDEADHQHLVTYTIAFGLSGTLNPAVDDPLAIGFNWPEPLANSNTTVDDMWHAAYNGRGRYLSAQNPEDLKQSLSTAINDIAQRTGTAAAVAINSAQLSTESVVYLAQFNSNRWQGNLLAFPIIDTDTGQLAATPKWDAAAILNARDFISKPRTVFTYNDSLAIPDGVAFQWANISASMRNDLKTNAIGGVDADAVGEARLDYLRGDRSHEGSGYSFRERLSMLSDIVNSGPVFVGPPTLSWPDFAPFPVGGEAYSEFKNGPAANRKKMVYVGANDGMLHAFDDDTGDEIFTYVPGIFSSSGIGEGLHYLTEPSYGHQFYVDLTPTLSDVYISSGASQEWHTVLVGGLRGGGRGIFALNVTDPSLFKEVNASKVVMWEFTSNDDADLGYTYSRPAIAYTNAGTWVAIFGNGYNDLGSGESSLFIVDIEKGSDGIWQAGDYVKISTGAGDTVNRNGLATPALADVDGNGTVDRVYAGDLQGKVWAFDLSSSNQNMWNVAYKSGSTPIPLFTTPAGQPATAKPVLAKHPTVPDSTSPNNSPNIMVFFGTGQYLVDADKSTTGIQSFYGVWDKGDGSRDRSHLIEQTFDTSFSVKVLTRNPVDYSIDYGWYFDLPETGERSVTSPIARADTVFFNSFVPVDDPCSVGGFGFKFAVDMATGGSPLEPTFDANNDGIIDENDMVTNGVQSSTLVAVRQEGFLPEPVFIEDLAFTAETPTKVKALKNIPVGRFSWQELLQ
ncbi:MAG: PilC/PilY family type IV pilus protein, partial [Gammaproteobacteria bacterium]|nr:PilC/PilY family type IV pilus protein [Gammaproteobacteria bacterium]